MSSIPSVSRRASLPSPRASSPSRRASSSSRRASLFSPRASSPSRRASSSSRRASLFSRRSSLFSRRASSSSSVGSDTSTGCSHEERRSVVFCDTCSKPLCDVCLINGKHRGHNFKTLKDACKDQTVKIAQKLENLASKARTQGNVKQWVERQEKLLEIEFKRVRDSLTEQYTELRYLLDRNMKQAFKLLETQRESQKKTVYHLEEDGKNYRERTEDLQTKIANLEERVSSEKSSECILLEIEAHQLSINIINEFYKKATPKNKLDKSRLEALEKSIQHIATKSKEIFPRPWEFYEDITFNPDNTSESLMISEDYTQVFISPNQTSPKIRTQDKETPFHILAKQSWKEGRHYWEVDVENCRTWSVGVVELASGNQLKTEAAGEHLGRDKSSWVLESEDGALAALHNDDFRAVKKRDVKRLGVYLDISKNKSRLTFYDVGGGVALHTFYALFKKEVFPAFSLSGTDGQVQSMALCNLRLMLDDTDSGLGSSRSSSTMSESGSSESSPEQWRNVVTTGPGAGYYDGP